MTWFARNTAGIEAAAALATAVVAVLALAGVALQLRAAEATSRGQTAREAYAGHLALAVSNPDFAQPQDACALHGSPKGGAYIAYVNHLLYAAELMLEAEPDWDETFAEALAPHAALLCAADVFDEGDSDMAAMLALFRDGACAGVAVCAP